MKRYLYIENSTGAPLYVHAKRRPSEVTIPRAGTWVVSEWYSDIKSWSIPCCPEITWGTINKDLTFVGEWKAV